MNLPLPASDPSSACVAAALSRGAHHFALLKSSPAPPGHAEVEADGGDCDRAPPSTLRCARCLQSVAHPADVISLRGSAPVGTYVNPFGYLHSVITLGAAQQLIVVGTPSTLSSWFTGYAWRMALCAGCGAHLGWRFSSLEADREPAGFWGLSRAALIEP